jgi:hypothetical protein
VVQRDFLKRRMTTDDEQTLGEEVIAWIEATCRVS